MNQTSSSRRRNIVLVGFVLFPLLLCGGVLAWFFGRQAIARHELDARIADLSQRGQPVDNESLQLFYEMATSDDVTLLWVTLGETLESEKYREAARDMPFHDAYDEEDNLIIVPAPGEDWPNRKPVDDFLAQWQSELKTLKEIGLEEYQRVGKPLRRPIRFQSIGTLLPDTQRARSMARLLRLQHAVAVYDGDQDLAFDCIRACLGVERSFDGEPIIISQLVAQAIGMMTTEMIRVSLEHDQLSNDQMDMIASDLPTFEHMAEKYQLSIRGERAMFLPIFHDSTEVEGMIGGNAPIGASFMSKIRARDALFYLDKIETILNISSDSPTEFRDGLSQFMMEFQTEYENSGLLTKNDHALTYNMMPAIEAYGESFIKRNEINNLAKLTMAVRRFYRQFERWPKSLSELSKVNVDAKALTPTVAQPFGFRIDDNGDALLWGVDRSESNPIPKDPPPIDGVENERNVPWVWRLRP